MKHHIFKLTFFFLLCYGPAFSQGVSVGKELTSFTVRFLYGDIPVRTYEMKVYNKDNKYFADNICPIFFYGKQSDSVWTTELDKAKIMICRKFISKAKKLPKECPPRCICVEEYTILSTKDTINISGGCKWGKLDFFGLRDKLFKEHFLDLEIKRADLKKELNKKLIGKWYFIPLSSPLSRDDELVLTRTNEFESDCFWEFGGNNTFKSSRNENLDLDYSKEYNLGVTQGEISLNIEIGIYKDESGINCLKDGAHFLLDTLTDNRLKLIFRGR